MWVYALEVLTCIVGQYFWLQQGDNPAAQFWSIGLWLWGIGALLAGTSYQAMGYHLKCRDGQVRWTNWWEVIYMICQQLSINLLLVATAFSSTDGLLRSSLILAAIVLSFAYTVTTLVAAFIPNRWLLSFEWMTLVSTPVVFIMLLINGSNALATGDTLQWALTLVWLGLIASMLAYWLYMRSGIADWLWARKKWFSENDVLHVTLIIWVLYIATLANQFSN